MHLFGEAASGARADPLRGARSQRGHTRAYPIEFSSRRLADLSGHHDRPRTQSVALPTSAGTYGIHGIPQTVSGFIPVDAHERSSRGCYCRTDRRGRCRPSRRLPSFPIKQAAHRTQQGDEPLSSLLLLGAGALRFPAPRAGSAMLLHRVGSTHLRLEVEGRRRAFAGERRSQLLAAFARSAAGQLVPPSPNRRRPTSSSSRLCSADVGH